jgi:hypothetical protein
VSSGATYQGTSAKTNCEAVCKAPSSTAGYNCVNNTCIAVTSNATYQGTNAKTNCEVICKETAGSN